MRAFTSLVLAGGAGRRFGQPKAFALLPDGRSFLAACVHAHTLAGTKFVAATLAPDHAHEILDDVLPIHLARAGLDMFESLTAGLRELVRSGRWQAVVIHPVDHPLVRPETITALVAGARGGCAIATLGGRHGHPVCLDRETAEAIADGTLAGPTLRDVLALAGACDVAVDDPGVRANCNTPEILDAAWQQDHRG